MNWYFHCLTKFAEFKGRAQRKEYWYFVLISIVIFVALNIVDHSIGTVVSKSGIGLFSGFYSVVVFIPNIAVSIRRLHDTNRTGWWILVNFIPLIGLLILLVFFVLDSTPGDNRFGPNPKSVGTANQTGQYG